jgi:hypothetical protein
MVMRLRAAVLGAAGDGLGRPAGVAGPPAAGYRAPPVLPGRPQAGRVPGHLELPERALDETIIALLDRPGDQVGPVGSGPGPVGDPPRAPDRNRLRLARHGSGRADRGGQDQRPPDAPVPVHRRAAGSRPAAAGHITATSRAPSGGRHSPVLRGQGETSASVPGLTAAPPAFRDPASRMTPPSPYSEGPGARMRRPIVPRCRDIWP